MSAPARDTRPAALGTARFVMLVLGLALLARVVLAFVMGNHLYFGDTEEYERAALSVLSGEGPGASIPRAPLYPLFMAAGFRLVGVGHFLALRLLQVVFGLAVVLLSGLLAWRLGGPRAGRLALLGTALAPTLIFTAELLYPTSLYTLLLLGVTVLAWELSRTPRLLAAGALGILLALAWLTDQIMTGPGLLVLLWLAVASRRFGRRGVAALGLAVLVLALAVQPWISYSRAHYGRSGVFLAKAQFVLHYARSDSTMNQHRAIRDSGAFQPLGAVALIRREAGYLRTRPLDWLSDYGREYLHFFTPLPDRLQTSNQFTRTWVLWLGALYFVPVLLFALLGLRARAAPAAGRSLLALVPLATAFTYAFFMTQTRYRIPTEPQLLVLAALDLNEWLPGVAAVLAGLPAPPGPGAPGGTDS